MAVGQVTLDKLAVLPDDFEEQKLVESDDNEHIKAVKFTGSQLVAIIWAFAKAKLAHPVLIEVNIYIYIYHIHSCLIVIQLHFS